MPEYISVEEARAAVEQMKGLDATPLDATPKRRGRPRTSYEDLPDNPMDLREQIRLVSQRLRRPAIPHKEFLDLMKLRNELQDRLKPRQRRSPNGIDFQQVRRDEAKRKREALAANKESEHGTQQ